MKNNYFQKKLRDSFFKIDYFYSKERSEKPLNPKHSLFLILPPKKANPKFSHFLTLLTKNFSPFSVNGSVKILNILK